MRILTLVSCLFFAVPSFAGDARKIAGEAMGDFGFKLFHTLKTDRSIKGPIAISPLSINEAMTLAAHGSEKETLDDLTKLLVGERMFAQGRDLEVLSNGLSQIRANLLKYSEASDAFRFKNYNSLWANKHPEIKFKFTEGFKEIAAKRYGAQVQARDFTDGAVVGEINGEITKATENKITKLISKLRKLDVAIILNAIYAKGKFLINFREMKDGKYGDTKATYMSLRSGFPFYEDESVQAVSLQVGNIDDFRNKVEQEVALDILVPKDGKVEDLSAKLNAKYYGDIVSSLKHTRLDLSITAGQVKQKKPFAFKKTFEGVPYEITRPFHEDHAQFSPMGSVLGNWNIYIGEILHKTFYEVNPFGFEAAAATAVIMARKTSSRPVTYRDFRIDGPSIHVIRHIQSGAPLFIVEYDSPKKYTEKEVLDLMEIAVKSNNRLRYHTKKGVISPRGKDIVLYPASGKGKPKVLRTVK